MPRKSSSSGEPTSAPVPNSPPSNRTRSNEACASSASNEPSRSSLAPSAWFARATRPSSGLHSSPSSSRARAVERVVALDLHGPGEREQGGDARQEDRRGLAPPARPHEPADGLREVQRRAGRGGVDAHAQARHVDPLGHHPHRHHPALVALGELLDPGRGAGVVRQHHHRWLAGDLAQHGGVRAGGRLVGGDDQPARVRHHPPQLAEAGVGGAQHRGHPLAVRVERGAPGLGHLVLGEGLAEPGADLVAGLGAPPHLPAVGQEHHRPDDAVAQGVGVAVGEVGQRAPHAVAVRLVAHERDRRGVGPERGAGEREPVRRGRERLFHGVAPRQRVTAVVHLVEHHQGGRGLGAGPVQLRPGRHLRVGERDAVVPVGEHALPVAEGGVELDAHPGGGVGPLPLEVLGGGDHRDPPDDPPLEQLGGHAQRERGLPGAGRGDREVVGRHRRQVVLQGRRLPGPQPRRGAPRGPFREGRGQVRGCRRAGVLGQAGRLGRGRAHGGTRLRDRRRRAAPTHRLPRPLLILAHTGPGVGCVWGVRGGRWDGQSGVSRCR